MKRNSKKIIQLVFLALFILLVVTNRPQLWMGLLLIGIASSFFLGRFYCGWVCSINTVMEMVTSFKRKHGIKNREIPQFIKKPSVRWGLLAAFVGVFIFTMKTGAKLPILPVLFLLGVFITFFFHEELWHRFLCPYGSILSKSSKNSKRGMTVDPKACVNCGQCVKVCPSLAIGKDTQTHFINKNECLVCMKCVEVCRTSAIDYK